MQQKVDITIQEIYETLCNECRQKLRDAIKEKLADQLLEKTLTKEK